MILDTRISGFSQLIKDLGVVGPQQGPIFGLEPIVRPVYIVGGSEQIPTCGPLYRNLDTNTSNVAAPWVGPFKFANDTARGLERGIYRLQAFVWWSIVDAGANAGTISLIVEDSPGGTEINTWIIGVLSQIGGDFASGRIDFETTLEILPERGNFACVVSLSVTVGFIGATLRFTKIRDIKNF